jgi:S-adenosylmethionine:tRNA ribosyltransferase-isomerase
MRSVNGLVTGLHEPHGSHLMLLERVVATAIGKGVCGACYLERAYAEARRLGYLWHEFGDSHLIIGGKGDGNETIRVFYDDDVILFQHR